MIVLRRLLTLAVFLASITARGQGGWQPVPGLPVQDYTCMAALGNLLVVGSGFNKVYFSVDGQRWQESMPASGDFYVTALAQYRGRVFVGTSDAGIFSTTDTGRTWTRGAAGFRIISGFAEHQGVLFASSNADGVARLDTGSGQWVSAGANLPTYSFTASSIVSTGTELLLAAGGNGTVYSWDRAGWTERYYQGTLVPGLIVSHLHMHEGVLMAGTMSSGLRVLRSADSGRTWVQDATGAARSNLERYLSVGERDMYLVTNTGSGSFLQRRGRLAPVGDDWSSGEEFFASTFTYQALELRGVLYLCQSTGLNFKRLQPSAADKPVARPAPMVYPNPSRDGVFYLKAAGPVTGLRVQDALGRSRALVVDPAGRIDLYGAAAGMYVLSFEEAGRPHALRVHIH